jgi:hypothetical protein
MKDKMKDKLAIPASETKPATGHQENSHQIHEDKRTKRERTRANRDKKAIKESSE